MTDKNLEDAIAEITEALRSARHSVERTNERVTEVLESINDPGYRKAISDEAKLEIARNPGFLDEVEAEIDCRQRTGTLAESFDLDRDAEIVEKSREEKSKGSD